MSYCTQSHITDAYSVSRIAEITGDSDGVTVDADKVTEAIAFVSAKITAALRKYYADLTFDSTNDYLRNLCVEGSFLVLKKRTDAGLSESELKEYKWFLDEVDRIANNKIDLRTESATEEDTRLSGLVVSNTRRFGRKTLDYELGYDSEDKVC